MNKIYQKLMKMKDDRRIRQEIVLATRESYGIKYPHTRRIESHSSMEVGTPRARRAARALCRSLRGGARARTLRNRGDSLRRAQELSSGGGTASQSFSASL